MQNKAYFNVACVPPALPRDIYKYGTTIIIGNISHPAVNQLTLLGDTLWISASCDAHK